jgi:hypothetical protein
MRRSVLVVGGVSLAAACGLELQGSFIGPDVDAGGVDGAVADGGNGADGTCAATSWTVPFASRSPRALALAPTGRAFVGGSQGAQAWVAEFDPCTGALGKELLFAPDTRHVVVSSLIVSGAELVASGRVGDGNSGENESGYVAHIDLALTGALVAVFPGSGFSDLSRVAEAADGRVWAVGTQAIFAGPSTQHGWVVVPGECSDTVGQAVTGIGVLPSGNAIISVETDAGSTMIAELDGCAVTRSAMVSLPRVGGPSDLTVRGGTLYVVGAMGGPTGNDQGYVAAREADAGAWVVAAPYDPSPALDVVSRVDTDEASLFAGAQPDAGFSGSLPVVARYALPLRNGANPEWTSAPFGSDVRLLGDLKVSPTGVDAIYVVGWAPGGSGGDIARCRKTTGCARPP